MAEDGLAIVTRVDDLHSKLVAPGSQQDLCSRCRSVVVVSQSTLNFISKSASEGILINLVCSNCALEDPGLMGSNSLPSVIPGQLDELEEILGSQSTDFKRVLEWMQMPFRETIVTDKEE